MPSRKGSPPGISIIDWLRSLRIFLSSKLSKPQKEIVGRMKMMLNILSGLAVAASLQLLAAEDAPKAIFQDKNLEEAVRKFVFEKRDNDKPLVEADLTNISIIQAGGRGISSLAGLEKCESLASLDISRNDVSDLSALSEMDRLQFLNAGKNEIEDISEIAFVTALQYLELSANRIRSLKALAGLTNLSALYLSTNYISDVGPITQLPRLSSLYLQRNQIRSIEGIGKLRWLNSLQLNDNEISDLSPLKGCNNLYYLFLENNKIEDLSPLIEMAEADKERRFAPFLNLFLKGNPLSEKAKTEQIQKLKDLGVRIKSS
jgi:Leucine-rich repeat (LRR) protein